MDSAIQLPPMSRSRRCHHVKMEVIYASEIFTRNLVNYNNSTISGS